MSSKMSDFGLFAAQVRAARGLLGWSQAQLAENIGVSRSAIVDLESVKRRPHEGTVYVLVSEFMRAGVNFTGSGVEFSEYPPPPFKPLTRT